MKKTLHFTDGDVLKELYPQIQRSHVPSLVSLQKEVNVSRGVLTLHQFTERIERPGKYQSLEPVVKIWTLISSTDRKAMFAYLKEKTSLEEEEDDFDEDEFYLEGRNN